MPSSKFDKKLDLKKFINEAKKLIKIYVKKNRNMILKKNKTNYS